jgi:hypothetical protein
MYVMPVASGTGVKVAAVLHAPASVVGVVTGPASAVSAGAGDRQPEAKHWIRVGMESEANETTERVRTRCMTRLLRFADVTDARWT